MDKSQNGYPAILDRDDLDRSEVVRGVSFPGGFREGSVAKVMRYVFRQFHERVEPLHPGWCWGYAHRPVKGESSGLSNHASGTAGDVNAPRHPLGAIHTFSDGQVRQIRQILDEVDGVVRWGGDYLGRKDEMHFEIVRSEDFVDQVTKGLAGDPVTEIEDRRGAWSTALPGDRVLRQGMAGEDVRELQRILDAWYDTVHLRQDGFFGDATKAAARLFQRRSGLEADGVVGPDTWRGLGVR